MPAFPPLRWSGLALLLAAAAPAARAQLTVPAGGILAVGSSTTLAVPGDLTNAGTIYNQGTVELTGRLSSTGTLPVGAAVGLWRLTGTSAQQLSVVDQLASLEIANAAGADLTSPLSLTQLNLSGGPLRLGNYGLTLNASGSITNADGPAGRFVITSGDGLLAQTAAGGSARVFPIGPSAAAYTPAIILRTSGAGLYALRVAPGALSAGSTGTPLTKDAVNLHWEVIPADATAFGLAVQWNPGQELTSFNRNQSALSRWTGNGYAPVEAFSGAGGSGSGPYTRTVPGLTAAGPYIVVDQQAPLPVELIRFAARRPAGRAAVELTWATAQELNNAGFEVQRLDEGQTAFRRVGFVPGQGSRSTPTDYRFADANDYQGRSYYRLRQLDLDGTETYSGVRTVAGLAAGSAFSLTAFPSPATTTLTLEAAGRVPDQLQLTLFAADGRLVWQHRWPAGLGQLALPVGELPSGSYWLRYAALDSPARTLSLVVAH